MIELTLPRNDLLNPLQSIIGAIERRQTMPMLANVLIRSDGHDLELTATDLEITLRAKSPGNGAAEGSAVLPARKLLDICKNLPDDKDVQIQADHEKAVIKAGKSRFTLVCLPPEDFPEQEEDKGASIRFTLDSSILAELVAHTAFSMAHQDVRYYLNGLMLELGASLIRAVATDGHRLAYAESPVSLDVGESQQVIVPKKGVVELQRWLDGDEGELEITLSANSIRIESATRTLVSKLIDGRFPDYNRVIPELADNVGVLDRVVFREALQRAAILSNEKYRGIRLILDQDSLTLQAHNSEQEEAQEELPMEYDGARLEVGFNVQYLMDICNTIDNDTLELSIQDPNSSALLRDPSKPGMRYVVMPMRL